MHGFGAEFGGIERELSMEEREREREGIREREIYFVFLVNSLKILIYFIYLRFDPIIKRKGP